MPTVEYPFERYYLPIGLNGALAPALEVTLIRNKTRVPVVGVLDSGSTITVFNPEHAGLLGIEDVRTGERDRVSTQSEPVTYYLFDLDMEVQLSQHAFR